MTIDPLLAIGTANKDLEDALRRELETAWQRGYRAAETNKAVADVPGEKEREAADYAERVVGGFTRLEKP
jgi:hypothetical protein